MTTTRPYRVPLPEETVIRELVDNRNSQFDPYLVDTFIKLHESGTFPRSAFPVRCPQET